MSLKSDRAVARLKEQRDSVFAMALSHLPHGVCMFDADSNLILCNPAYVRLYTLPPDLTLPGTPLQEILDYRHRTGSAPVDMGSYFDVVAVAMNAGGHAGTQVRLCDGRTIEITHKPLGRSGYVACHEDVSATVEAERHIRFLATHDPMTGLANRTSLIDRLVRGIDATRPGGLFAIHGLDLDGFKSVNDTFGHVKGDMLLKAATARLLSCVRQGDMIARLGGDEFVLLQFGLDRPEQASTLAARLIEELSRPFDLHEDRVRIGLSIGIAVFPGDGANPETLLRKADVALYRAKLDGKNTFRHFEPSMDGPLEARRRLELDLREALARESFALHYQPVIDTAGGTVNGFEALLRWTHPDRGNVPPLDFIPLCEETGLIVPLGEWVLRRACADAVHWPASVKVAVNLSAAQFRNGRLTKTVREALEETGLPASRLELEITESVLLVESDRTLRTLQELRALGVRIALDDFGTGYSSLNYLRSFPFDKIKIDRCFAGSGADCEAIVRAVTELGAALNIATTAEGIETAAQLKRMRRHGCSEVQGFLFGRPGPVEDVMTLLYPDGKREGRSAA